MPGGQALAAGECFHGLKRLNNPVSRPKKAMTVDSERLNPDQDISSAIKIAFGFKPVKIYTGGNRNSGIVSSIPLYIVIPG